MADLQAAVPLDHERLVDEDRALTVPTNLLRRFKGKKEKRERSISLTEMYERGLISPEDGPPREGRDLRKRSSSLNEVVLLKQSEPKEESEIGARHEGCEPPLMMLPDELLQQIVITGGLDVGAALSLTCRRFHALFGFLLPFSTRKAAFIQRGPDDYFVLRHLMLYRNIPVLNLRGGWHTTEEAGAFLNYFASRSLFEQSGLQRLDVSLIGLRSPLLKRVLCQTHGLQELILDDVNFGRRQNQNKRRFGQFLNNIFGLDLKRLSMRRCGIDDANLEKLARHLQGNRELKLDLKGNNIQQVGPAFRRLLPFLKSLNLSHNRGLDLTAVCNAIEPSMPLCAIFLRDVGARRLPDFYALTSLLEQTHAETVDLRDNPLDESYLVRTAGGNKHIKDLRVGSEPPGRRGPRITGIMGRQVGVKPQKGTRLSSIVFSHEMPLGEAEELARFFKKSRLYDVTFDGRVSLAVLDQFLNVPSLRSIKVACVDFEVPLFKKWVERVWQHENLRHLDFTKIDDAPFIRSTLEGFAALHQRDKVFHAERKKHLEKRLRQAQKLKAKKYHEIERQLEGRPPKLIQLVLPRYEEAYEAALRSLVPESHVDLLFQKPREEEQ